MRVHKKRRTADDEDELQRREMENGIDYDPEEEDHPHEISTPVGEDQREYMTEELKEQGYTDDGLENPNADEDSARSSQKN